MAEEQAPQSIHISGGQISNVQIGGLAGRDQTVTQTQQVGADTSGSPLSQADVIDLISQLEQLFSNSVLPDSQKTKAIQHLETVKEEAQAEEPDKEFAAKRLQRATKVLKEAGETVEAGTSLWQKVKPILETISPWLGVATSFLI
ncbi:MAG: hypothetical protein AAF821_08005 [Cyanobacteria bacterium P01_D01_bin.156]